MTKVAITANTSWYIYNFRKNTILSLIEMGFEVVTIAPRDSYSRNLEALGCSFFNIDIDQGGKNPFKDLKTLWDFKRIFSKNNIDVVLNFTPKNNIYSTLAASRYDTIIINNIAGLGVLFVNESITSKIARLLYKRSQHYAHKVFFQNEEDRELFINNNIVDKDITDRIPGSGADLLRFELSPSVDDGVVRFLLIARMLYDKGIEIYVEAARILKEKYNSKVEFSLLGFLDVNNPSSVTKEKMSEWVDEGIVSYLGTSDRVEDEISKVDCMVLPSFYREGVPKSLLEAGAMGKPIVTTDHVGCRETVEHGITGFLCEPRSTESLVKELEKIILLSHEERLVMGKASRQKIKLEFDENIIINKYLTTIKHFLNAR